MEKQAAQKLIEKTLSESFNKSQFINLIKNIFNHIEETSVIYSGKDIYNNFSDSIQSLERVGKYNSPDDKQVDILIVHLTRDTLLDRARAMQRNYVAKYLKESIHGMLKDAALVAFVAPNSDDWRFSFVKMEYKFNENGKVQEEFTPARRYSFLVGKNENSHTAQSRLLPVLRNDEADPTLEQIEQIFSVEQVTKEFFAKYRDLFLRLKDSLDDIINKDDKVKSEFKEKNISTADFSKKTLGQIVFLYFLQKKGWFGVARDEQWGSGSKHFLCELFKKHGDYKNFFNDILEPLFYEALGLKDRSDDYYSRFDCKIPFLNGGLFDPLCDYDWVHIDILLPNDIFYNDRSTLEGDTGNGILDIFDRYNFTVKEDEPLEKEVAVDPEMLGKVFENLLESKDRKSKGAYYTPRAIVHYMCQESLANYLVTELAGKVSARDIEILIKRGEDTVEHDRYIIDAGSETEAYSYKLPQSVREHAQIIDDKLSSIRVCDPAVGSGAFVVGMMNEIIKIRSALTTYIGMNNNRTPYHFKRHAIQNCLYGVDIDPGAVEIAKLRLWLSLVVDEEERDNIQPLPNLDYKIMQGNSLLSIKQDIFNEALFRWLEKLKLLYFNEASNEKKHIREQIDATIAKIVDEHEEFDFEVYFSEVFHEKKGFDVVIANPPYISALEAKKTIAPNERMQYKNRFYTAKGAYDLYVLFFELGINILRSNGTITYISPSKYLSARYAMALREYILNYSLIELADFSDIRAFESTGVSTLVTIIYKGQSSLCVRTRKVLDIHNISGARIIENEREYLDFFPEKIWGFLLSSHIGLVIKIWKQSVVMKDIAQVNASSTSLEADEYSKLINTNPMPDSAKIINTKTIDRIINHWGRIPYKNKKSFISEPYIDLSKVSAKRKIMYLKKKLIFSKVARSITSSYDKRGEFASTNTNFVYDSKYHNLDTLSAYTNSNLADFIYKQLFAGLKMSSSYQFQAPQLRILPVPRDIGVDVAKKFQRLVNMILEQGHSEDYLKNPIKQAKVREYEKQIDQLVYNLYGLTEEEIKIVENA